MHNYNTMEYQEALNWLYRQKKTHKREDLNRIKRCIEELELSPTYKVIHIAGTNGKGSTASYLNQIFLASGHHVGMFVSPYVISFRERIEVDGHYIPAYEVIRLVELLKSFSLKYQEKYQDTIPFFELTLLMALVYFKQQHIDILVLECGLGGRLDATNALKKDLAIITTIGYDHMQQLGPTLEEIALHKLGITRENVLCLTAVDEALYPFFLEYAKKHSVPLKYVSLDIEEIVSKPSGTEFKYQGISYTTSLSGTYQASNASLAIAAIHYLYPEVDRKIIQKGLTTTLWPGRFEHIRKNVILDGAHNIPAIEALSRSLRTMYPNRTIKVVFTALKDKAIPEMLSILDKIATAYYFTTISDTRASQIENFTSLTQRPYLCIDSYEAAIHQAVEELKEDELLVITGSLHFISVARKLFVGEEDEL